MAQPRDKLAALRRCADQRDLTPVAWWIGRAHHDDVLDDVRSAEDVSVRTEGGRLSSIDGLDVKVLTETPDRLALWCEEGALDL